MAVLSILKSSGSVAFCEAFKGTLVLCLQRTPSIVGSSKKGLESDPFSGSVLVSLYRMYGEMSA